MVLSIKIMNRLNTVNKNVCMRNYNAFTAYFRLKSHYHTLELDSTASAKDIKAAYCKLSVQYHPDKNEGREESVAKFREITEAYEVLSNPEKKKKYDFEYLFQAQYASKYYPAGDYYESAYSKKPFSDKTKDFDFDKRVKQHYENIKRRQEMEQEYFRRRWNADFYERYPTAEEYYKNKDEYSRETSQHLLKKIKERRRAFVFVGAMWTLILLMTYFNDFNNPDRIQAKRQPFYYKVSSKDDSVDNRTTDIPEKEL